MICFCLREEGGDVSARGLEWSRIRNQERRRRVKEGAHAPCFLFFPLSIESVDKGKKEKKRKMKKKTSTGAHFAFLATIRFRFPLALRNKARRDGRVALCHSSRELLEAVPYASRRRQRLGGRCQGAAAAASSETNALVGDDDDARGIDLDLDLDLNNNNPSSSRLPRRRCPAPDHGLPRSPGPLRRRCGQQEAAGAGQRPSVGQGPVEGEFRVFSLSLFRC